MSCRMRSTVMMKMALIEPRLLQERRAELVQKMKRESGQRQ